MDGAKELDVRDLIVLQPFQPDIALQRPPDFEVHAVHADIAETW